MTVAEKKLKHLEWAIQSRARNQRCSLKLLTLFEEHESIWKTSRFARAAQDLVAVSFSLWRAAFLADKTAKRIAVFEHGKVFLERVIEDNAISYPQDKASKEWTFNYYTRNARTSLENLAKFWKDIAPPYQGRKRRPMERWDYCQSLLEEAVTNFEKLLRDRRAANEQVQQRRTVRSERRQRRAKVRQLTLAQRKDHG